MAVGSQITAAVAQSPKGPVKMAGVPVEIGSEKVYENMFSYFKTIDDLNVNWMYEKNAESNTSQWVNVNVMNTMNTVD